MTRYITWKHVKLILACLLRRADFLSVITTYQNHITYKFKYDLFSNPEYTQVRSCFKPSTQMFKYLKKETDYKSDTAVKIKAYWSSERPRWEFVWNLTSESVVLIGFHAYCNTRTTTELGTVVWGRISMSQYALLEVIYGRCIFRACPEFFLCKATNISQCVFLVYIMQGTNEFAWIFLHYFLAYFQVSTKKKSFNVQVPPQY